MYQATLFTASTVYKWMRKGKCDLGVSWPGQEQQGNYYLV